MSRVAHFSINADDTARASRFYEAVFGWKFKAYGPPGFFKIESDEAPVKPLFGALQQRRELVPGAVMRGFECSISVDDIQATATAIENNGGKIVMPICTIPGVGKLLFFQDTERNIAGAMQYEAGLA